MEHERGGIDRLVSNKCLFDAVRPLADTSDPLVRQELAAIETGYRIGRLLVLREVHGPGAEAVLGRHQGVLHRVRAAGGGVLRRARSAPSAMLAEPGLPARVARSLGYAPAYTIMGGTSQILRNILGERVLGLPEVAALDAADLDPADRREAALAATSATSTRRPRWPRRRPAPTITGLSVQRRRSRAPPPPARRRAAAASSEALARPGSRWGASREPATSRRGLVVAERQHPHLGGQVEGGVGAAGPQRDHRAHLGVVVHRDGDVDAGFDHGLHERRERGRAPNRSCHARPTRCAARRSSARSRARPAATVLAIASRPAALSATG